MGPIKIVLDTNIYLSAVLFGGLPERVLDLARSKVINIYCSNFIILEIQKILRTKFSWSQEQVALALEEINSLTHKIIPKSKPCAIKEDPSDNNILACALDSGASFIVSGDHHLLELQKYENIVICTPRQFFDQL